jgi:5'-nucleotidase
MMKRILVDMDGVLADVYSRFIELHEEETGHRKTIDEIIGRLEGEVFPNLNKWVKTPGFFRSMPVIPDSQRVLRKLNDKFDIVVISMATEFPDSLTDKQLWLAEHFPYISWKQLVLCGNKNLIKADIMIDDHCKNLDSFKGETIIFSQPHNIQSTEIRHKRVDSWKEIERLLLPA